MSADFVPERLCSEPDCIDPAAWFVQPDGRPIGDGVYVCHYDLGDVVGRAFEQHGGERVGVWQA